MFLSKHLAAMPFCNLNLTKLHHFDVFIKKICTHRKKIVTLSPKLYIMPKTFYSLVNFIV